MADNEQDPKFDLEFEEPPAKAGQWFKAVLILLLVGIVLAIGGLFLTRGEREAKRGTRSQIERELDAELSAIKAKQDWLVELSRQLEIAKADIESGQLKGKKVIDEYQSLAAQQRQERETLLKMREAYNAKVQKFQEQEKE